MTPLLILLLYFFHCGKATVFYGPAPLAVRSSDLNCWSSNPFGSEDDPSTTVVDCGYSNWGSAPDACYFLAWRNTKIDHTLDI